MSDQRQENGFGVVDWREGYLLSLMGEPSTDDNLHKVRGWLRAFDASGIDYSCCYKEKV